MKSKYLWLALGLSVIVSVAAGQSTTTPADKITLMTGMVFSGVIESITDETLQLRSASGSAIDIRLERIRAIAFGEDAAVELKREIMMDALSIGNAVLAWDVARKGRLGEKQVLAEYPGFTDTIDQLSQLQKAQKDSERRLMEVQAFPLQLSKIERDLAATRIVRGNTSSWITVQVTCPTCHGRGRVPEVHKDRTIWFLCPTCWGRKTVDEAMDNRANVQALDLAIAQLERSQGELVDRIMVRAEPGMTVAQAAYAEIEAANLRQQAARDAVSQCEARLREMCEEIRQLLLNSLPAANSRA